MLVSSAHVVFIAKADSVAEAYFPTFELDLAATWCCQCAVCLEIPMSKSYIHTFSRDIGICDYFHTNLWPHLPAGYKVNPVLLFLVNCRNLCVYCLRENSDKKTLIASNI